MSKEIRCANCPMRKKYDKNPNAKTSKVWRWHINWCPGWKAYMDSLDKEEYEKVQKQYNWKIN